MITRFERLWDGRLPRTVIHGDFNLSHVFEAGNHDYILVDTDRMRYGRRLDDLGKFLLYESLSPLADVERSELIWLLKISIYNDRT